MGGIGPALPRNVPSCKPSSMRGKSKRQLERRPKNQDDDEVQADDIVEMVVTDGDSVKFVAKQLPHEKSSHLGWRS